MLTDLCIFDADRIVDVKDDKKKKNDDEIEEEGEDENVEPEFLNLSELYQEWDNEDPKINCNDEEESDQKNQQLLRNLRAYEVPIIIIKQQAIDGVDDQNSYLKVLEKCYIFLIKFVRNNKENQKILLEYIDLFMDDIEYGVHSWELFCEIFKNSEHLHTFNIAPYIKRAIKFIDG